MRPFCEKRQLGCGDDMNSLLHPSKRIRCSLSAPLRRRRTRVQFSGEDRVETFEKNYTAQDHDNIWWSRKEMKDMALRDHHAVHQFITSESNNNSGTSDTPTTTYRESVLRVLLHSIKHPHEKPSHATQHAAVWIAHSDSRGLERDVVGVMRKRRHFASASVLATQDELAQLYPQQSGWRAQLLAERCQELSRSATVYSQLVAQGDALMAQLF